jgi:hypothetical protein
LNLGFAALGHIFKTGLRANAITFTPLLSTLCAKKRPTDAMNIVLRRILSLAAAPMSSPTTHFSKDYVLRINVKRLSSSDPHAG